LFFPLARIHRPFERIDKTVLIDDKLNGFVEHRFPVKER